MAVLKNISGNDLWCQSIRYGIVGLVSNITLYMLFLILVELRINHTVVVTFLYVLGLSITFISNKKWSFSHTGGSTRSITRYILFYVALWLTNVIILWLWIDVLGFPPAKVQACVLLVFIPIAFLAQRYWIFMPEKAGSV